MGKSPGFWFFTGDWLKDPELRFCSIFARGLLVDLLCILFEAKECGYASKPNGSPRSDEEIVQSISGGTLEEKLKALSELEQSGVLSRDSRGVLFSRRLSRLAELSKTRSKVGSKGGSKTQANVKQTIKQKPGVSDSDSDSVSEDTNKQKHPFLENEEFSKLFETFKSSSSKNHNWFPGEEVCDSWLYELTRFSIDEAKQILRFSTSAGAKKPILNGDHKPRDSNTSHVRRTSKVSFDEGLLT